MFFSMHKKGNSHCNLVMMKPPTRKLRALFTFLYLCTLHNVVCMVGAQPWNANNAKWKECLQAFFRFFRWTLSLVHTMEFRTHDKILWNILGVVCLKGTFFFFFQEMQSHKYCDCTPQNNPQQTHRSCHGALCSCCGALCKVPIQILDCPLPEKLLCPFKNEIQHLRKVVFLIVVL